MFSVIFDMDGTLLDTQQICIPAWEYAGKNQGVSGMGAHVPNVCGMNKVGWSAYITEHFPTIDVDRFNREIRAYVIENIDIKYKSGAVELLEFLKQNGIKMGLASGSSEESVNHHLKEVDAFKYFDAIVPGTSVEKGKPEPDIFLLAAERMGVDPETCFVFEDSQNGIIAGYRAGMKCIGVPDIAAFNEETKKIMFAEIKNLAEAIELLKPYI